jgi:DNA polymerase-3 subunit alpha
LDNTQLLREKAFRGLEERGFSRDQKYIDQLEYELKTIEQLGFVPYFLIMWDIARFAREKGILYGPGRGSGAGSLLNYCLKITLVDPIKYNLYFQRFLNPHRVSPPDIDWDCADREQVITYLEEKYGHDKVARVGSINFLRTKSGIRDVGRVLGRDYSSTEDLANLVPPPVAGLWESFEEEAKVEPKLLDERYKDIIDPVRSLWGTARSYGTHAGGVAIAPGPINEFIPLYKDKEGNSIAQFDYRDLEAAGLLKFDLLGLSTLEVIKLCLEYLKKDGIDLDIETLEDGDTKTYDLICSGDLDGIFQLGGSESIKQLTVSLAPRSIEDLSTVTSLFRPGPLGSKVKTKHGTKSMTQIAVDVRQKKMKPEYIHECVIPILERTWGVPTFQEQIMRICTDLCGYSPSEADYMRKILGKKLQSEMEKQKPKFVAGAQENGMPFYKLQLYYILDSLSQSTLSRSLLLRSSHP